MPEIVTNAFSLNMLTPACRGVSIVARGSELQIEADQVYTVADGLDVVHWSNAVMAVGHHDTAELIRQAYQLPQTLALFERRSLQVEPGDTILVFQYRGPRLPEGTTTLPEGATLEPVLLRVS